MTSDMTSALVFTRSGCTTALAYARRREITATHIIICTIVKGSHRSSPSIRLLTILTLSGIDTKIILQLIFIIIHETLHLKVITLEVIDRSSPVRELESAQMSSSHIVIAKAETTADSILVIVEVEDSLASGFTGTSFDFPGACESFQSPFLGRDVWVVFTESSIDELTSVTCFSEVLFWQKRFSSLRDILC